MAQFDGTSADDTFYGSADDDTFISGGGKDWMSGLRGNDTFVLTAGLASGSSIDGGRGRDVIVFDGERADYPFKIIDTRNFTISKGDDFYAITSVEVFRFTDGDYVFSANQLKLVRKEEGFDGTFRLFASEGFVGEIGGAGSVIGTAGSEHIIVSGDFDRVTFDSSFNRGGDIIEIAGPPRVYTAHRSGSSAVISDDISTIIVPVGAEMTKIRFSYTEMPLWLDGYDSSKSMSLGNTVLNGRLQPLPDTDALSIWDDPAPNGSARIFLNDRAEVILGGHYSVIGDAETQRVDWRSGDLTLSSSFNAGGDVLRVHDSAENLTAYRSGSNVVLNWEGYSAVVPVGTSGLFLHLDGAANAVDSRKLFYDAESKTIRIGDQVIDALTEATAEQLDLDPLPPVSSHGANFTLIG